MKSQKAEDWGMQLTKLSIWKLLQWFSELDWASFCIFLTLLSNRHLHYLKMESLQLLWSYISMASILFSKKDKGVSFRMSNIFLRRGIITENEYLNHLVVHSETYEEAEEGAQEIPTTVTLNFQENLSYLMQFWYFGCCPSIWILIFHTKAGLWSKKVWYSYGSEEFKLISYLSATRFVHGFPTPCNFTQKPLWIFAHSHCSHFQQHFHQNIHSYVLQEGNMHNVFAQACRLFPRYF